MPSITGRGPIEAWIIDDASFPKKGRHSAGVSFRGLVDLAKLRRWIERDYQDLCRKSASGIMRAAAGGASIITARYQSQPTAS
jgi:SRSO17 transposase